MDRTELDALLELAKKAVLAAGEEIMQVYESFDEIESVTKNDSHSSPLTEADTRGDQAISEILGNTDYPLLTEEGKDIPYQDRSDWEYFWLIDPLDGTKEFIKKNGEFTVNIALIKGDRPVMGVVFVPAKNVMYWGIEGDGAFKQVDNSTPQQIHTQEFRMEDSGLKVVGSRSHMNEDTEAYIAKLNSPEVVSMGSSLKLVLVAEGDAHLYPRFGPTMEWDTAAAHAIVNAAGGKVLVAGTEEELSYNKENLLNPYFLVEGDLQK